MTINDWLLNEPAARAIAWALLQFLWQGALIGLVTALTLASLRRSAADVRYVVATIGLSLMLTMPIVTAVQAWQPERGGQAIAAGTTAAPDVPSPTAPWPATRESGPADASGETAIGASRALSRSFSLARWQPVLLIVWLCGVLLLSLRLLTGWVWVQRMKSVGTRAVREDWLHAAARLCRQLHIGRPVRLLESTRVDVPTVIGWLKPIVLLPTSAMSGLAPQQLEAILAHELAHIRRHDYLVNLLQTLVETLLFYHPAVWWLSHRIRVERENCCDDLAVSLCGDPYTYAQALADLEGLRGASPGRLAVAVTGGSLGARVRRLLGAPSHAGRCPGWLAGTAAALLVATIVAGAVAEDLKQDPTSDQPAKAVGRTASADQPPAIPAAPPSPHEPSVPPLPPESPLFSSFEPMLADLEPMLAGLGPALAALEPALASLGPALAAIEPALSALQPALAAIEGTDFQALSRELEAKARDMAMHADEARAALADHAPETEIAAAEAMAALSAHQAPMVAAMEMAERSLETHAAAMANAGAALESATASLASQRDDGEHSIRWSDGRQKLEIDTRGTVEFTDDDADVKSLSPGGRLRIKEGGWLSSRTVEFTADGSGAITRRFWSGVSERPFEPEGRQWLAEALPRIIRQTGLGAPARVARIYKAKGVDGVLAEISLIKGSWGKRIYFRELLKTANVDGNTATRILAQAGREIDSDFELASMLIDSGDRLMVDEQSRRAFFDAARSIESDFEMRRVFSSVLKREALSPDVLATMLDASTAIDSDFEAASLLIDVAKSHRLDDRTRAPFFKALGSVDSDFEQRRVLSALARTGPDDATTVAMLEAALTVDSDFEQASFLLDVVKARSIEGTLRAPFFKAVEGLGSSFERGRVLKAIAGRADASSETVLAVLQAASGMGSSFETAEVLLAVANRHQLTGAAREAYIDAAEKLGDFEQGRALSALVKGERARR